MLHTDSSIRHFTKLLACLGVFFLQCGLADATPGNAMSSRPPPRPFPATQIPGPAPPPMPSTLYVPKTIYLDNYASWLPFKLRQIPQYQAMDPQVSTWREDTTPMLIYSQKVHEQMANSSPFKRQYVPLMYFGHKSGSFYDPQKVYAMPLNSDYFRLDGKIHLSQGSSDQHTYAVLGISHPDPNNPYEPVGRGPRVALFGFADVKNAPSADLLLPELDSSSGHSQDLYHVLSIHP